MTLKQVPFGSPVAIAWGKAGQCLGCLGVGPTAQVCPTFKQGSCIDKAQLGGQFLTLPQVFVRDICPKIAYYLTAKSQAVRAMF